MNYRSGLFFDLWSVFRLYKSKSFYLFLVCALVFSAQSFAYAKDDYLKLIALSEQRDIANSIGWKNLLHYDGHSSVIQKGSNFFLAKDGNTNARSELKSTLQEFFAPPGLGDDHAICRYPARFNYLRQAMQLEREALPKPKCRGYDEYLQKVPIDSVSLVFASENPISPSTMMGHTFIKISGQTGDLKREHAFSYFAKVNDGLDISFYAKALVGGIDGSYALSPYTEKEHHYIQTENRSLWEFKINLTQDELALLHTHLWELKEKNIEYSLTAHNCNTALMSIFKVSNPNFDMPRLKAFTTPVEYIQYLDSRGMISHTSITPTSYTAQKIIKGKLGSVLNAPKPSRISFSSEHHVDNYFNIEVSPVYQDLRDWTDAYSTGMESKMLEIDAGYNLSKEKLFIRRIDLLRTNSLQDYSVTNQLAKSFRLALESNLRNDNSELRPTVEGGVGISQSFNNVLFYIIPKVGYRYSEINNFYLSPNIGFTYQYKDKLKIISSFTPYIDLKKSNRSYKNKSSLYASYNLNSTADIFSEYNYYSATRDNSQFILGFTHNF